MKVGDLVELSALSRGLLSYRRLRDIYGIIVEDSLRAHGNYDSVKVQWFGDYNRTTMMLSKHLRLARTVKKDDRYG